MLFAMIKSPLVLFFYRYFSTFFLLWVWQLRRRVLPLLEVEPLPRQRHFHANKRPMGAPWAY